MPDLRALDPLLLPMPRSLVRLPGWLDLRSDPMGMVLHRPDRALPPQGYRLHVGADAGASSITVSARDDAGIAHAQATLGQLFAQYGERLPRVLIEDSPAFATRGVMLDVSRDRVPTMARLFEQTLTLASLKVNHLQLYTEHTFAYPGHEGVWEGCSPVTPEEMRRLDQRCQGLGVALAANQNCFGHLTRWLTHPRYAPLAETHEQYDFYGVRRAGPFSLCPTDPGSLELVGGWLEELLPCVRTPLVNIGCDETADVGQGRSRGAVASRGRFDVYMGFVRAVADLARGRGSRPMFWADVALHHPERAPDIPPDLLSLVWGYEPQAPFEAWCHTLASAGREFWVCPGTSSWRSITGRTRERHGNLAAAASAGLAHGATGWLATDWGDLGHRQQAPVSDLGLAHAAAVAWNPRAAFDPRAASLHALGDRTLGAGPWLEALGDADAPIRAHAGKRSDAARPAPLTNAGALFEHLHPCGHRTHLPEDVGPWQDTLDRLDEAARRFPAGLAPLLEAELRHTLDIAVLAARHAIWARAGAMPGPAARDLADRLEVVIAEHRRLWLARSRSGGLDDSAGWYERLLPQLLEAR